MSKPESKGARFRKPLGAIQSYSRDEEVRPDLNVEMVALSKIEIDPENKRVHLDPSNPAAIDDNDPQAELKREELANLRELAGSIEKVDLVHPITIYPHGAGYRIATGERRFLAHVLLGRTSIKATIRDSKPRRLRLAQLIENVQRQDQTIWQRIQSIQAALKELEEVEGIRVTTAEELGAQINYRRSSAFNWWALVRAPSDVLEDIQSDRVAFNEALALARTEDPEERTMLRLRFAGKLEEQPPPSPAPSQSTPRRPGRPATTVALGSTKNSKVVRRIFEAVRGDAPDLDWGNPKEVAKAFRTLLKELEAEL